ncbi:MAG: calcium/sodium antiporter [Legionellales bacterium]|nr:calcium/sodium antiporter [Legionellales bacterium]
MTLFIFAVLGSLVVLVWSAHRFVDGSAALAQYLGMPSLIIGMVIVGFGTSSPEMAVSVSATLQHNVGIALGNAYGSNIVNIGLILGLTALISPIKVHSQVLRKELPILIAVTALALYQAWDGHVTRLEAATLLLVFSGLIAWTVWVSLQKKADVLANQIEQELKIHAMTMRQAIFWIVIGLMLLIISSKILVFGAVGIARSLGVSDLIIGLTIVAIGTSLPELASSLIAIRKGEHDIALGNVLGSNLFNTLAVVGIAGIIHPLSVEHQLLHRDMLVMALLTVFLFVFCYGLSKPRSLNRCKGLLLLISYGVYLYYLIQGSTGS